MIRKMKSSLVDNKNISRKRKDRRHHQKEKQLPSSSKTHTPSNTHLDDGSTGVCEHVSDRFEKVGRVGQGTYGIVYKARDKQTGKYVALKRCIPHHESSDGFPLTTLRELQTLRIGQNHPHIVKLLEVAVSSTNGVFLVFEFCSYDVARLLDAYYPKYHKSPFEEAHVKTLTQQLLSALHFLHTRAVLHRDIKPSNLLYDEKGRLQLADFGLSRHGSQNCPLTPNVVSLW